MYDSGESASNTINLNVEGGQLKVSFDKVEDTYKNVMLIGPATQVFKGEIEC